MIIRRRSRFIPPQSIEGVERVKTMKVLGGLLSFSWSAAKHHLWSPWIMLEISVYMLSASYDPTVYPNLRFMKWQEQPPWHGFCTPLQCFWQDTSLTFSATNNSNRVHSACFADAAVLVAEAETRLMASVVLRPHHVFRPLFPPVIIRRPGLRHSPQTLYFLTRTIVTLFQEPFTVPYYTGLFTPQTFSLLHLTFYYSLLTM